MNKAKKAMIIIAVIMLIAILTGKTVSASADAIRVYPDVPLEAGWAKPVYWASEKGYVQGFKGGRFGPEEDCTRQQFVIIVWRMNGRPSYGNAKNPFSDVGGSTSGYKAIMWAVEEGIIKGFDDGTFRPESPITRGQVAMILWRTAGRNLADKAAGFSDVNSSMSVFKPVSWCSEAGIIKGFDDGTFRPDENCTRAQIVTMFYRYKRNIEGGDVSVTLPNEEQAAAPAMAEPETHAEQPATQAEPETTKPAEPETPTEQPATQAEPSKPTEPETQHTHTWKAADTTTMAATCTAAGSVLYECSVCGEKEWHIDEIPALGHDWEKVVTREAWTEEITEQHTFCKTCELDYTQHMYDMGYTEYNDIVAEWEVAHRNQHRAEIGYDKGYTTREVIIDTVEHPEEYIYRCTRCQSVKG